MSEVKAQGVVYVEYRVVDPEPEGWYWYDDPRRIKRGPFPLKSEAETALNEHLRWIEKENAYALKVSPSIQSKCLATLRLVQYEDPVMSRDMIIGERYGVRVEADPHEPIEDVKVAGSVSWVKKDEQRGVAVLHVCKNCGAIYSEVPTSRT